MSESDADRGHSSVRVTTGDRKIPFNWASYHTPAKVLMRHGVKIEGQKRTHLLVLDKTELLIVVDSLQPPHGRPMSLFMGSFVELILSPCIETTRTGLDGHFDHICWSGSSPVMWNITVIGMSAVLTARHCKLFTAKIARLLYKSDGMVQRSVTTVLAAVITPSTIFFSAESSGSSAYHRIAS